MKTNSEYRAAAWKTLCEGRWIVKFLCVVMALTLLMSVVDQCWQGAVKALEIQTWGMFFQAKAKALLSGLDLTVPSRTIAMRMTEATAFEAFVSSIANGILAFGLCGFALRVAKGDGARWFARSFGGFACPLGVAWLYFRFTLQVALWTLLFVIPGVMAYYRYCQCWNLKVEHPDWPAGKCLAESARMMQGHKARRFALDLSFWRQIGLLVAGLAGLGLCGNLAGSVPAAEVGVLVLTGACLWGGTALGIYMAMAQALFYLDLGRGASAADAERLAQ